MLAASQQAVDGAMVRAAVCVGQALAAASGGTAGGTADGTTAAATHLLLATDPGRCPALRQALGRNARRLPPLAKTRPRLAPGPPAREQAAQNAWRSDPETGRRADATHTARRRRRCFWCLRPAVRAALLNPTGAGRLKCGCQ
jgi:hypothetical protein